MNSKEKLKLLKLAASLGATPSVNQGAGQEPAAQGMMGGPQQQPMGGGLGSPDIQQPGQTPGLNITTQQRPMIGQLNPGGSIGTMGNQQFEQPPTTGLATAKV